VKQAVTMTQSYELPQHTPALEAERVLMVDLAANRAQAMGVAPAVCHKVG
jgi:hypothetical protein